MSAAEMHARTTPIIAVAVPFIQSLPLRYSARSSYSEQVGSHNVSMAQTQGCDCRWSIDSRVFRRCLAEVSRDFVSRRSSANSRYPSLGTERRRILEDHRKILRAERLLPFG